MDYEYEKRRHLGRLHRSSGLRECVPFTSLRLAQAQPIAMANYFMPESPEADLSVPILLELDEPPESEGAEHYDPLDVEGPENEIADEAKLKENGESRSLTLEDMFKDTFSVDDTEP